MENEPRNHHYVPQFFLRNFATDLAKKKIASVAKHENLAVWSERSIERIGFERDFYVHMGRSGPVSVETAINERIETPVSKSDTWAKISSGRTDTLDRSDKPIIYALIRHLESRTPHYLNASKELARMATSEDSEFPFAEEERLFYASLHANPDLITAHFNVMAASLQWTEAQYSSAALSIYRSPIPLRSSSTPALAIPTAPHPAFYLPLPGMIPFQLILTLNPTTVASLILGDFDGAFTNTVIPVEVAKAFNRHFVAQFSHFEHVRHLITDRDNLSIDMTWAPYDITSESPQKIVYRRRSRSDR